MSRTHKTKPLNVKACQGLVSAYEVHDHTKGPCDLPKMTPANAGYGAPDTNCYWQPNFYEPLSFCGCHLCTGNYERKINTKRNRKAAKTKTREWVKDPKSYDEEVIEQKREFW